MSYKNQYLHPKVRPKLSGTAEEMIRQFVDFWANHEESVGKNLTREFQALQVSPSSGTTVINRSGSGSSGGGGVGGSSKRQSLHVEQSVSGSGTATVSFVDVGSASYGVMAYVLKSNGDFSQAYPLCPPRADSRSTNSVQVDYEESGSLHVFIILD